MTPKVFGDGTITIVVNSDGESSMYVGQTRVKSIQSVTLSSSPGSFPSVSVSLVDNCESDSRTARSIPWVTVKD